MNGLLHTNTYSKGKCDNNSCGFLRLLGSTALLEHLQAPALILWVYKEEEKGAAARCNIETDLDCFFGYISWWLHRRKGNTVFQPTCLPA